MQHDHEPDVEKCRKIVEKTMQDAYTSSSLTQCFDRKKGILFDGNGVMSISRVLSEKETCFLQTKTCRLENDRATECSIDWGMPSLTVEDFYDAIKKFSSQFTMEHLAPELDAYRFAQYASVPGIQKPDSCILDERTILPAIDQALQKAGGNDPHKNGHLFICSNLRVVLHKALRKKWGKSLPYSPENYNDIPITYVPPNRFYTDILLLSDKGYKTSGSLINFILVDESAVYQEIHAVPPKIISPANNRRNDSWLVQLRFLYDALVFPDQAANLYLHTCP